MSAFQRANELTSQRGHPRKRCQWLLADKGYDADALRRYCDRYRMQPVIPLRSMKRKPKPGLPRLFDRQKYRQRNIIERMFGWLKENRRIVTRFDKLAKSYVAMVSLACTSQPVPYWKLSEIVLRDCSNTKCERGQMREHSKQPSA